MVTRPQIHDRIVVDAASVVYRVPGGQMLALQSASLRVSPEEFVCLIGPSGCGKTTLTISQSVLYRADKVIK